MATTRPGPLRYIGYAFGRKLPDEMREWVRNDLTGDRAVPRHIFRAMVPLVPIFIAALFIPGSPMLKGASLLLGLMLALFYSIVLIDPSRRRRLIQHGLPEDLQNPKVKRRRDESRARYEQTHRTAA